MATDVQICSAALMLLGAAPIASLAETGKSATLCANLYPLARKDLMRRHPWNCCIKRVLLAPLASAPEFDYTYQFAKPGDWLRVLNVGEANNPLEYEFAGNRILCDTNSLPLRYVADITEGNWDSHMVDVMVKRMCSDLAYPITKSTALAQLKLAQYNEALKIAKSVDGQENPPEQIDDSPFIAVRSL